MKRYAFWIWLVAFVLAATLPLLPPPIGTEFYIALGTRILIMAIFALSLQLLVGYTGLVSLGHAAFFACAAYTVAMLTPEYEAGNGWWLVLASIGTSGLLALVIGILVMRTRGIYFIMATLAFAQMVYFVFHDFAFFGGSDGTYIYFRPEFSLFGWQLVDLEDLNQFYWFTLLALLITVAVLAQLLRSRLGHAIVGIKYNEQRMRATGYDTMAYKLASFVIGGMFAGLAGFLFALQYGFVNPEFASWHQSGNGLLMIILGGLGSLPGAVLGAVVFELMRVWYQDLTEHWQLLLGGTIIAVAAFMPKGLMGGFSGLRLPHRRFARVKATAPAQTTATTVMQPQEHA